MEPIGVAASLATLIRQPYADFGSALSVTAKAISYLHDVKNASKERQTLAREAADILQMLVRLQNQVEEKSHMGPWTEAIKLLDVKNGPIDQLREALEQLAKKLKPRIGVKRAAASALTWTLDKTFCDEILKKIERFKTRILLAQHGQVVKLLEDIKVDTAGIDGIKSGMSDLQSREKAKHQHHILDWFSPLNFFQTQQDILKKHEQGTGKWLLDKPEFQQWLTGSDCTLCCRGIPGAGKSVLAAVVVDFLRNNYPVQDPVSVAALYCNFKDEHTQTAENLLAALCLQLIGDSETLPGSMESLYRDHGNKRTRPTLQEILKVLQEILEQPKATYVIVDALDECTAEVRSFLVRGLKALRTKIRLLVTTRPIDKVIEEFQDGFIIDISASEGDLRRYITSRIESSGKLTSLLQGDVTLATDINDRIISKAHGMFLAAKLHMDSLSTKLSIKTLKKAIENLPHELNELYDDALRRIDAQNDDDREIAISLLRWVAYAYRPLTIGELEEALAIVPGEDDFDPEGLPLIHDALNACAGLLVVDDETELVRMVHYTAQDYFDKLLHSRFQGAHTTIAEFCITYLSYKVFQSCESEIDRVEDEDSENDNYEDDDVEDNKSEKDDAENQVINDDAGEHDDSENDEAEIQVIDDEAGEDGDAENRVVDHDSGADDASEEAKSENEASKDDEESWFHLLDYVSRHWVSHATTVQGANASAQIHNFIANGARVWLGCHFLYREPVTPRHPADLIRHTGCAIAAYHGLDQVLKRLLRSSPDVNELTYTGVSALHLAAYRDHVTAVNILLDYGANIEQLEEEWPHLTPLCRAVKEGSVNVSRLLVERGANVNAGDFRGCAPFANVDWDAPIPFLQLLLDSGAELNSVNFDYDETQLGKRARSGDEGTVRWLLGKGALVNNISARGTTALACAIENGSQSLVRLLLDHGAEVNPKTLYYLSPLYRACVFRQVELGRILVEHGALVNSGGDVQAGCEDRTALHVAASDGYRNCVDFLIEKGANVHARERDGYTPLLSAIAGKADSDTPDDGSFLGIINSLLNAHANIDEQDKYGLTALHIATANGDVVVIRHLLEHHAATSIRSSLRFGIKHVGNRGFPYRHFSFRLSSGEDTKVALYDPESCGRLEELEVNRLENTASEYRAWESGLTALDIAIIGDQLECIRILKPLTGARTPSTTMSHGECLTKLLDGTRRKEDH